MSDQKPKTSKTTWLALGASILFFLGFTSGLIWMVITSAKTQPPMDEGVEIYSHGVVYQTPDKEKQTQDE